MPLKFLVIFWFPANSTYNLHRSAAQNCTVVRICTTSYHLPRAYDASACRALVCIYIYIYMDIMTPQMDGITDGKRPELCTFKHSR